VGAVDGVMVKIIKPAYNGTQFYCRKGFFAINVQAVVDHRRRITYLAISSSGSTHDSTAFKDTKLYREMMAGKLPVGFYLVGDDAYSACGAQMLCPYAGRNLVHTRDVFNFYQSRTRIAVECAFGELVGRWGILWRTLRHGLPMATAIIQACARLHNWCLNHRVDNTGVSGWQATAAEKGDCDLGGNPLPIFGTTGAGRQGQSVVSPLRDDLAERLVEMGMKRPARSTYRS
jgi:hypothetical protein